MTAVVLSIGEPYVERALASLARQTEPPVAIVHIEGTSPFHRALNEGIARVRSEHFVHIDADMIPDPTALGDLRACMAPGIGVAIGGLRDPLLGSIVGIKLYRTAAAAAQPCPDSITPAVDFLEAMRARGWRSAHAIRYRPGPRELWHTFGEHRPAYSPHYTFHKFRVLGARYRYWRNGRSLRRWLLTLGRSGHASAAYGQIGAVCGLFSGVKCDDLRPWPESDTFERIRFLLAMPVAQPVIEVGEDPRAAFHTGYRTGCDLAARDRGGEIRSLVESLGRQAEFPAWSALVGVCRGILAVDDSETIAGAEWQSLLELFPYGWQS